MPARYPRADVRCARSSRDAHVRPGPTGRSRPRRRCQSQAETEPVVRGWLDERPRARSGQSLSVPVRQTSFTASKLKIGATGVPRHVRGPRQRRRDLGGSLRRRCERRAMDGDGAPRGGEISKRLHAEVGDGGAGDRCGLTGWPRRARKRRGALGRRTMGTLVPRRCDHGARTGKSHGTLVHGHARPVRHRAVSRAVSADLSPAAEHASGDHDQHQSAEQEPQARPRSQEQPFPHEAQDNSGHLPQEALDL